MLQRVELIEERTFASGQINVVYKGLREDKPAAEVCHLKKKPIILRELCYLIAQVS